MNLETKIDQHTYQPVFFRLTNAHDKNQLEQLLNTNKINEVIDSLEEAIEDLFKIDFPFVIPGSPEYKKTLAQYRERYYGRHGLEEKGVWVYFPWRQTLVHLPDEQDFYKLRTTRNKFLITSEEQDKFYDSLIGIAGLSIGSSVVNSIILSGGGGYLRIGDPDTLAMTNLNRVHASVCDLMRNKTIICARRAYEFNPFQKLEIFNDGLTLQNMNKFFGNKNKLDLFIEEMDDIKLKIEARFKARELGVPVVMATDNGDNTIIDVERFDLEPNRPLFHGRVNEKNLKNVPEEPSLTEKVKLANSIVGPDVTPRMQFSLTMVGSKIPAWPQLGNAATLSSVAVSYVARRILIGEEMPSGRYEINLDSLLDPNYHSPSIIRERQMQKKDFITGFEVLFGKD